MSSEPTSLECKGAPLLPAPSTGFRAFNATNRFPPNPASTASMLMGRAPIKSHFLPPLSPNLEEGTCHYCHNRHNVPSENLSRRRSQRSCTWTTPEPTDPRARMLLPREGLSNGSQCVNHSRRDVCYKRTSVRVREPIPNGIQEISSGGTRTIIARVRCNKTGRRHAGMEASSRPAPYPYRGLLWRLRPVTLSLPLDYKRGR